MLNIFNGPPVSFNRDGGPSLAYGARTISGVQVSSEYSMVDIQSQGRPFYITEVVAEEYSSVYMYRSTSTLMDGVPVERVGDSTNEFGSVDTTCKTFGGNSSAVPANPAAKIGFPDGNNSPWNRTFRCPVFARPNEIISFKYSNDGEALELTLFWVEIFND